MSAGRVNLREVADDVIDLAAAGLAKPGVRLRNKIEPGTPMVSGRLAWDKGQDWDPEIAGCL